MLRAQPFEAPGDFQHFRLFALVTSARDRGSAATEAAMLIAHLTFWTGDSWPGLLAATGRPVRD